MTKEIEKALSKSKIGEPKSDMSMIPGVSKQEEDDVFGVFEKKVETETVEPEQMDEEALANSKA